MVSLAHAQGTTPPRSPQPANLKIGYDFLSDTSGINISPYMRGLAETLKERLESLGVEAEGQSTITQEDALIRITIAPDGHILAMSLENPIGDPPLAKVVWAALKDMPYQPLPPGMRDPDLQVRVHVSVN